MSEYKTDRVSLVCDKCKTVYTISTRQRYSRIKENLPNICKNCYKDIRSQLTKDYHTNLSDEEKLSNANKRRERWNNLSDEEKYDKIKSLNKGSRVWWNSLSEEDKEVHSQRYKKLWEDKSEYDRKKFIDKLSSNYIKWWNNLSEDEKQKFADDKKQWWENLPEEEKCKRSNRMAAYWANLSGDEKTNKLDFVRNLHNNLSDEAKEIKRKRISDKVQKYWDNITPEQFQEWKYKRAIGYNEYLSNLDIEPNKNELEFMNKLKLHNIEHQYQWYNTTMHPDFNNLFPYNLVTNSTLINPYHSWDFIIHRGDTDILVDIDGGIHDPSKIDYEVTDCNNKKFKLIDLIQFNDSQRPYQTDNLPAYIVQCYDDNITDDTKVLSLHRNEVINVKQLLALLTPLPSKKELKEYIKDLK